MTEWIEILFTAWFLTVVLENIMAYICGIRRKRDYFVLLLMNSITNPLAMLLYQLLGSNLTLPDFASQIFVEILVYLVEVQILRKCIEDEPNPWLLSLKLNAFSFFPGVVFSLLV